MNKYLVTWTEEVVYGLTVEAEDSNAALDIFDQSKYDMFDIQVMDTLGVQTDSIEVEAI